MIHSTNRNKGYTLIELMVVVGIISLLLGLGINGLDYLIQWNKLNTEAALLSSELKNTQSRAFYEGVYYKLQFWPTLDRYRIYKQTELIDDIILKGINLFNTNFTYNNLYFYPNGVPSMGGTITLKNKRGKVLYVIMTPVTARVRVSPEPPENW
jgi:prepilin-type N-terminal cleavage/methylation domain-containing protein